MDMRECDPAEPIQDSMPSLHKCRACDEWQYGRHGPLDHRDRTSEHLCSGLFYDVHDQFQIDR